MFKTGDAVIIKKGKEIEVGIIENQIDLENETFFEVTKYIFARNLKKLFKKQGEKYDEKNEVVQDLSSKYIVNNTEVVKKCQIALLCLEDNVYYITESDLNPTEYFSCRFTVKGNQLFPIVSNVLAEKSLNSPITKVNNKILKQNIGTENTPEMRGSNPIEIYFENEVSPPAQRNSVKRDLNKSFGNSPSAGNKSILNYSIITISDEEDNKDNLILKLKVSKKRNGQTTDNLETSPKIRKSNRRVSRKSYADYISPQKISPNKRQCSRGSEDDDFDPGQNNSRRTPRKQRRNEKGYNMRTPKQSEEDLASVYKRTPRGTPARRSLRLTTTTNSDNSRKSARISSKHISYNEDEMAITNLDDSLRRNILKTNLKNVTLYENDDAAVLSDTDNETNNNLKNVNLNNSFDTNVMRINLEKLDLNNESFKDLNDGCKSDSDSSDQSSSKPNFRKKQTKSKTTIKKKSLSTPSKTSKSTKNSSRVNTTYYVQASPKTPRSRAKLIREGIVTPTMHERSKQIKGDSTPLMKARSQLHVSYIPDSLPCREKEYCDIFNFVEGKLLDGCGGCMYISGVPGTGKTATVTSVISHLQTDKNIPKFNFVNINGMRLTEPRQSYVEILKQLKGKSLSWEQAQNTLDEMFVKPKKMTPIVMLIDELDILCTKRQDVVYNLLDWPTKAKNQLVIITIANTMDLPERLLMNRVTSRLGLTRLTFQAYTYKQLQEIVTKRLCGADSFNPDAVQFVARKVASVSGDARRALDICRRAAEIAEVEGKEQLVNMSHVNEALSAMITQPKVLAIKSCSRLEQLILQSVVAEVERTGVEETTFCDIYKMLITCAGIEGFKMVSSTLAQTAVNRLSACRLILADQKCNNIFQKIILNVSVDDVYYALKRN